MGKKNCCQNNWGQYTALGDTFLENLQGLTTLKIYRADDFKNDEMNVEAEKFRKITMKVLTMQLNSITIMDLIAYGGAALGVIMAVTQYQSGGVSLEGCLLIILLAADFFIPMRQLGSFFHIAMNGMAASDKIFRLLDLEETKLEITESFPSEHTIRCSGLSFSYEPDREILHNVDLAFHQGSFTALVGESGCGKSVLGQAILGILPDYVARSGNIFYRSTDILADNTSLPGFYGQQIALIPQNPGDSLNPLRTIGRQFDDILQTAGLNDKTNQRKQQLLTFFGLPDAERVLAAYPHELSGGMLQRVLCAMSICCSPLWLLADEPTKGLDETACGVVYENLQKIKTSQSLGMLIITHDLQLARSICADIAVMYAGQIVEYGPQVLTGPRHPYTQAFLAALPENGFQPLPGLPPLPQDHLPGCRFAPRCPSCQKRCLQEVPPVYDSGTAKVRCFLYA